MTFIDAIKERFSPSVETRIEAGLRLQPFLREFWLAEDYALETILTNIGDLTLNRKIADMAEKMFNRMKSSGLVPSDQDIQWRRLNLLNARRLAWWANDDLQEEVGQHYANFWVEKMKELGVFERFQKQYVKDGKSTFIQVTPDKPYF